MGSSRWAPRRRLSERFIYFFYPYRHFSRLFIIFYHRFSPFWPQRQRRPGDALQGGQGGGQDGALRLHGTRVSRCFQQLRAFQLDPKVKFPFLREKAPVLGNSELWASPWTRPVFLSPQPPAPEGPRQSRGVRLQEEAGQGGEGGGEAVRAGDVPVPRESPKLWESTPKTLCFNPKSPFYPCRPLLYRGTRGGSAWREGWGGVFGERKGLEGHG